MPYALFDTPLGTCAIAWRDAGVTCIELPGKDEEDTRARVIARGGEPDEAPPPAWVRAVVCSLARHLEGSPQDLEGVRLDLSGVPPFFARVYEAARAVPPGSTVTYAELAARAGSAKATRAVGQAMARNPFPVVVPCHRVLAAAGKPGGFSAFGGTATKERLLALEGVPLAGDPAEPARRSATLFDGASGLRFDPEEATRALVAADAKLARVIARVGPLRLRADAVQTPFAALAESIVYQQLTGKAAATILKRVHAAVGGARRFGPEAVLAAPDADLRAAGLSGAKTAALKDLAAKTLDGTVPSLRVMERMDEEALVERLTAIRGVGRWTVEMLLLFRLGLPDVLPTTDYGIRKGFARAFSTRELPTPSQVAKRGERWRPYRSAASWYLWRAAEEARGAASA